MADDEEFREAASAFLSAAWEALGQEHIVPRPWFHPHIQIGRDYFGESIMGLAEYHRLEGLIEGRHPRFHEEVPLGERDFPGSYITSFLQAFVARSAREQGPYATTADPLASSIQDLKAAIDATSWEVACCRVVSHLTTVDLQPVELAGVEVTPLSDGASVRRTTANVLNDVIKGAGSAFGRDIPFVFAPPESVLAVRSVDPQPFDAAQLLSGRIERFLLATRLLWAGTSESVYEVQGETARVRRFSPTLVRFRGAGPDLTSPTAMVRRTVRLSAGDQVRLDGLLNAIQAVQQPRDGMAVTSFGMALQKFQLSYHAHTWYEQLVDLATALEAALSGKDTTDVLLRLRTRAAALLASEADPAARIFADVGTLYELRSKLVHGGELTERRLEKLITQVSTVPESAMLGTATGYLVDRMRDLVRRSLLARIALALGGEEALWPLGADPGVDAALADDDTRVKWRNTWRDTLASFEAERSADPAPQAVATISQEDR